MTNNNIFAPRTNTLVRSWRATAGAGSPLVCTWTDQTTRSTHTEDLPGKGAL